MAPIYFSPKFSYVNINYRSEQKVETIVFRSSMDNYIGHSYNISPQECFLNMEVNTNLIIVNFPLES